LLKGDFSAHIDSLNIHYTIKGSGPALFVGHLNSGKIGYERTLTALEDRFTMVYYDSRGTGKSEAPNKIDAYQYSHLVNVNRIIKATFRTP
jgi:proline iminopeptidase